MAIDEVKFRKAVVPGDQLHLEVVPLRKGGAIWKMRGEGKVEGKWSPSRVPATIARATRTSDALSTSPQGF